MKLTTLTLCTSLVALGLTTQAQVSLSNTGVSGATSFPSTSISGLNGTLAFQDLLASPSGATIAGAQSQGPFAAGSAIGETFLWTSGDAAVNGDVLSAFTFIDTGGGGGDVYQPFLFNLGSTVINANGQTFNPSSYTDMLGSAATFTMPALGSANFVEIDFSGADLATLTPGDNYAIGILNTSGTPSFNFDRANGTQSDPNGAPFNIAAGSGGLSSSTATATAYGGGPRNIFMGLDTVESAPEPASLALLGLGGLAGAFMVRRRKA